MSSATDNRETARTALEQVCSRQNFALAPECYAADFADHVNGLDFYGLELSGITISRLRDGRIVEDWTASDGIELLRALGVVRVLRAAPRMLKALRTPRRR